MQRRLLLDSELLQITIQRLCRQLIENHDEFKESVILGLQPRGIFLAQRIKSEIDQMINGDVNLGFLDTTFHRDDFRRREEPKIPSVTKIDFLIENKKVILIDDVLYTGRTVRAALDAMISFGRPQSVEYLALVDRIHSRDVPIEGNYIGKKVNTLPSHRVSVELKEQGGKDNIWLENKEGDESA